MIQRYLVKQVIEGIYHDERGHQRPQKVCSNATPQSLPGQLNINPDLIGRGRKDKYTDDTLLETSLV
jgi:hypothetical protein